MNLKPALCGFNFCYRSLTTILVLMYNIPVMKNDKKFPLLLLTILFIETLWSFCHPYDLQVWWTEFLTAFFLIVPLVCTYKKFRFSNLAYFLIFLFCFLQIIGAHYTFERVPFDMVTQFFGFTRNHYDRVAHFTIGLSGFLVSEFLWRKKIITSFKWAAFFGIIFIMAAANFWELVEWTYAEIDGGSAGLAFLGSQGDIWDAQKDMLMDTLGAIVACVLFCFYFGHQKLQK